MKREILFRGKAIENGEWVYGDFEYNPARDIARVHHYDKDGMYVGQVIVDKDTVGQFVGLCDMHGNKIFEGDIVKTQFSEEPFGVVRWHINGYWFVRETCEDIERGFASHLPLGELMYKVIDGERITLEVVGNIYEKEEEEL